MQFLQQQPTLIVNFTQENPYDSREIYLLRMILFSTDQDQLHSFPLGLSNLRYSLTNAYKVLLLSLDLAFHIIRRDGVMNVRFRN